MSGNVSPPLGALVARPRCVATRSRVGVGFAIGWTGSVTRGSVRFGRIVNLVRIGQVRAELVRTCLNLSEPARNLSTILSRIDFRAAVFVPRFVLCG